MTRTDDTATEIAAALALAGVDVAVSRRGRMMHVTVHTPLGWVGDKGVLASRVLDSLKPSWEHDIAGADVAVIPAEG